MSVDQQEQFQPHRLEMKSVLAIEKSGGTMFRTRTQIREFVELPLVEACEELWDRNILTVNSSANSRDVEIGYAYIGLDRESLSPENKKVAEQYGQDTSDDDRAVYIHISIGEGDTDEDVRRKSLKIVKAFKKQPMTWAPTSTLGDLKTRVAKISADSPRLNDPKEWQEAGYYYDKESDLFYLSEEHFKKATEKI